ncbi:MAG: leader peptidase (prepilin peptidase)/N-methyltransferase [Pseudohongiellaceae bacterium]|jgi:leader peptidase (prepilin peptidase)/N-methyltransferase
METALEGWFGVLFAICLGLSVGSFGNVLIYRLPIEGLSTTRPARSFCPKCNTQLSWFDNLPLIAWISLRGRCRSCQSKIPWRYPAVELLVGLLFALYWWLDPALDGEGALRMLVTWYLVTTCVVISAIDLEHFIIPDAVTLPGIAVGLGLSVAFPILQAEHFPFDLEAPRQTAMLASVGGILMGGGSLWLFGQLGNLMLRKKIEAAGVQDAMGLGDVKWMAFAGAFLGPLVVADAILVGCFLGAIAGIVLQSLARLRGADAPPGIPFGPYLSVGILAELVQPGLAWELMQSLSLAAA